MTVERREDRFPVHIQGRYRTGNGMARDVSIGDLSTHGCRFFDAYCNLSPGALITLRIGSIGPLDAQVRWVERQTVGVMFANPIHASVLDHMRTIIDDWRLPKAEVPADKPSTASTRHADPQPAAKPESTGQFTVLDLRNAMASAQVTLPLRSEYELLSVVAWLHRNARQ